MTTEREYREYRAKIKNARAFKLEKRPNQANNITQYLVSAIFFLSILATFSNNISNVTNLENVENTEEQNISENSTNKSIYLGSENNLKTRSHDLIVDEIYQDQSFSDGSTTQTAKGKFIILSIRATNITNQTSTLEVSELYIKDLQGRKYQVSYFAPTQISGINGDNFNPFSDQILPGMTNKIFLIYDINSDAEGLSLEYEPLF